MYRASAKELFVLGRVSLRPTHGHQIMRTLRESRADLWIELSEKHVYYVLRKLDNEGLIAAVEQPAGKVAARRVYSITDAGRAVLAEMMAAGSLVEAMPYSQFDVVLGMLSSTDALDDGAKSAVLQSRRDVLTTRIAELAGAAGDTPVGGFPALILARVTSRLTDELSWLESITAEVDRAGWGSLKPALRPASGEVAR